MSSKRGALSKAGFITLANKRRGIKPFVLESFNMAPASKTLHRANQHRWLHCLAQPLLARR